MKALPFYGLLLALLLCVGTGSAAQTQNGRSPGKRPQTRESLRIRCTELTTAASLLACVLAVHPVVQRARARLRAYRARQQLASQSLNPELEGRAVGGAGSSAELTLLHTFELGGKRDARIAAARAGSMKAITELHFAEQRALVEALDLLVRLRHMQVEDSSLEETRRVYSRMAWRLSRYPYLNPSNRAALTIFKAAAENAALERAALSRASTSTQGRLRLLLGGDDSVDLAGGSLPAAVRKAWPQPGGPQGDPIAIRLGLARVALARAGLSVEESEAWPNLSLGPAIDYRRSALEERSVFGVGSSGSAIYGLAPGRSRTETEVGFSVRITLPLYHRNDGGIATAKSELAVARTNLRLLKTRAASERRSVRKSYESAVPALSRATTQLERQERAHAVLERQMLRGTIEPALVVELHRELLESIRKRNDAERETRLLLLRLRLLQGHPIDRRLIDEIISD